MEPLQFYLLFIVFFSVLPLTCNNLLEPLAKLMKDVRWEVQVDGYRRILKPISLIVNGTIIPVYLYCIFVYGVTTLQLIHMGVIGFTALLVNVSFSREANMIAQEYEHIYTVDGIEYFSKASVRYREYIKPSLIGLFFGSVFAVGSFMDSIIFMF